MSFVSMESFMSIVVNTDMNTLSGLKDIRIELNKMRLSLERCDHVDAQIEEVESDLLLVEELMKKLLT